MHQPCPENIKDLVFDSLSLTHDGIGVFDAEDVLVYCNDILASMFSLPVETATGMSFDDLIRHNYEAKSGLNIETESLPEWLDMAHRLRRSRKFRSFEVDRVDHRWFLVTEHTAEDDTMLIFCSEITRQKANEAKLLELNEKLTDLAYRDPLTDCYNRRYFYELAGMEVSRCLRQQSQASVLMIDLDDFKAINDTHGHETGDVVLIESSVLMRDMLRSYDVFGRIGGEEFAVLLPDTAVDEANEIARRILERLRIHSFAPPLDSMTVTASIGAAALCDDCQGLDQLMRHSDKCLYEAKRLGKNQVVHQAH